MPTEDNAQARLRIAIPVAGLLLGGALVFGGARRRDLLGTFLATAGGVLMRSALGELFTHAHAALVSPRPDLDRRYGEGTRDVVEEASWESFPASDPPAFTR